MDNKNIVERLNVLYDVVTEDYKAAIEQALLALEFKERASELSRIGFDVNKPYEICGVPFNVATVVLEQYKSGNPCSRDYINGFLDGYHKASDTINSAIERSTPILGVANKYQDKTDGISKENTIDYLRYVARKTKQEKEIDKKGPERWY